MLYGKSSVRPCQSEKAYAQWLHRPKLSITISIVLAQLEEMFRIFNNNFPVMFNIKTVG